MDERLIDFVLYVRARPGIASASVAEHFDVSVRTVRNWLHETNEALVDAAYISSANGSYTLTIRSQARFDRLVSIGNSIWSRTPSTSDRRAAYLLSNLLFRSDWVTIDALAEELFVTRRTISTSLKTVEKELEAYGLRLERRPHHGIRVAGDELARRRCIARLISINADLGRSALISGYAVIGNTTVGKLSACAREVLDAYGLPMSGTAFRSFLVHLCISLGRAEGKGWGPVEPDMLDQLKPLAVYPAAAEIAVRSSALSGSSLGEADVAYLVLCIVSLQAAEGGAPGTGLIPTEEASALARQALDRFDQDFRMQLARSESLHAGLSARFTALLVRLRYGFDRDTSPLMEDAKSAYPLPFEMAATAGSLISRQLSVTIPEAEIGALALYLARVLETHQNCADGLNVLAIGDLGHDGAHLLELRLRQGLGAHAADVTVRSATQLVQEDLDSADVILASVAMPDNPSTPVIRISPFPSEHELGDLRLTLARLPRNER